MERIPFYEGNKFNLWIITKQSTPFIDSFAGLVAGRLTPLITAQLSSNFKNFIKKGCFFITSET